MARVKNLQPWLDYFRMLQRYEEGGFLQMDAEKHEAYVTRAALCTLAADSPFIPGSDTDRMEIADFSYMLLRRIPKVVRHIRTYGAWLSREGRDYLSRPFAINVVDDEVTRGPEPLYTITVTPKRRWWKLWMLHDHFDVIAYH